MTSTNILQFFKFFTIVSEFFLHQVFTLSRQTFSDLSEDIPTAVFHDFLLCFEVFPRQTKAILSIHLQVALHFRLRMTQLF